MLLMSWHGRQAPDFGSHPSHTSVQLPLSGLQIPLWQVRQPWHVATQNPPSLSQHPPKLEHGAHCPFWSRFWHAGQRHVPTSHISPGGQQSERSASYLHIVDPEGQVQLPDSQTPRWHLLAQSPQASGLLRTSVQVRPQQCSFAPH